MYSKSTRYLAALALCVLGGCSTTVDLTQTDALTQAALPAVPEEWAAIEQQVIGEPVNWVSKLQDPKLSALVAEAQQNNPSLMASEARLKRARSTAKRANAALAPQLAGGLTQETTGLVEGGNETSLGIGLNVQWEADLWGRLANRRSAAEQSLGAVRADYRGAKTILAASVAQAYYTAIEAKEQGTIAREVVTSLLEIERIANVRQENGLASPQEVAIARSDLATARDRVKVIEGAEREALRALETLLGRYPSAQTDIRPTLPSSPTGIPAGLPSEILERRPDLVAAERRVAASLSMLSSARTARLPQLSLTGDLGGSSSELTNILSPSNLVWSAASSLLAPIFTAGAIEAEIEANEADVEEAVAAYASAAITAFSEVETALDQGVIIQERSALLGLATQEAESAYKIETIRYNEGATSLLDALSIQQRVFEARSAQVSLRRLHLEQYIALNLALGGDW